MRQFMTKRMGLGLGAGILIAGLGFGWPHIARASGSADEDPAASGAQARALPVEIMTVEETDRFATKRVYTGRVEARRVADLAFERSGLLLDVSVDEGSPVIEGQALARLDTRELDLDRRSAVAERDAASAKLKEMRAGPRAQTIEAAREVVKDLESQVELARRKQARRVELNTTNGNAIADEALEEVEYILLSSKARAARGRQILGELEAGTREEVIAAQDAVVRRLDARIESIDLAIEKSVLRAPFAGTIAARHADEGAVPSPQTPLLTLVESDTLEARIGVPPDDARQLPDGAKAKVRVGNHTIDAILRGRRPQIDEATRTQRHIFDLTDAPAGVVRGQLARIELDVEIAAKGVWVPHSALVRAPRGLWACYVVIDDGIVARREVSVVHTDGGRVYVRGTLRGGERLIRSGAHRVVAGQRVRVEG